MIPQIKKILYATDLSKNSSFAFLYATDMAKRHNAKIVILHAIEPIPPYAEVYSGITYEMERKQQEETGEELKKHLQGFCKKAEAQIDKEDRGQAATFNKPSFSMLLRTFLNS